MSNHNPLDRELSQAEKAQIIGFYRQSQNVLMIMGVMELRQNTVETVIETYLGTKLANSKNTY